MRQQETKIQHTLSPRQAIRIALNCQLLDSRTKLPKGKEGTARVVDQLGYVQIDTIAVVERAHHHTLWTRCPDHRSEFLDELLSRDRRVFEYWGHAASVLPMSDYRYYLPRMKRMADPHDKWNKQRLAKCGHLMGPVLKRIREEGPLGARDFETNKKSGSGNWWEWKPSKIALELLFWKGEIMISSRRNFQRRYDLTERVLPAGVDTTMPSDDELGRFLVRRALSAYGIATANEIVDHLHAGSREIILAALDSMVENGEVLSIGVRGEPVPNFALPAILERGLKFRGLKPRVHILSPFDNLIILRDRVQRLFGFEYTLECYTPAAKRKYGYFVLPILRGEELVGRLDTKAERKKETLVVKSLQLEKSSPADEAFVDALACKLREFAAFNGCERVQVVKTKPTGLRRKILTALK